MTDEGVRLLAAALAVMPLFGVAMALGKIFSDWISSLARNPAARDTVQPVGLIAFALTEAVGLFTLIIAFLILFVG